MGQDKVVRKNLAYVGAVTKIARKAMDAIEAAINPRGFTKGKGLFTQETVDKYAGVVEKGTGRE